MAEFGATLCSNPGCLLHDFLPFTCAACGLVFCLQHYAIGAHACEEGEAYLAARRDTGGGAIAPFSTNTASHPLSSSKPSEVMAAVTSRFEGREDELNNTVTHYNIKGSEGDSVAAGTPDKRLKNSQIAVDKASTDKGKRVSSQVHRMLLKSKSVGHDKLRMEDRFFLEVHYSGNDEDVHHLYFSRLWTVGRTLDDILKTRRRYLRLGPGEADRPLELACTDSDSSRGLQMGRTLNSLAPELQSFDAVTVRPRVSTSVATSSEGVATVADPEVLLIAKGGPDGSPAVSSSVEQQQVHREEQLGLDADVAGADGVNVSSGGRRRDESAGETRLESLAQAAGGTKAEKGMRISVGHGKAVYQLGGISPECSVLDIKRRLEPLTGVPFVRQKLLFKGVLRDGDLVGATKIVEGAKVMLLGSPPPASRR